eukprot:8322332-Alexandrium_andersonii.AAC.1
MLRSIPSNPRSAVPGLARSTEGSPGLASNTDVLPGLASEEKGCPASLAAPMPSPSMHTPPP